MVELKLYNTLTRQKEVFQPEDSKNVRLYVCGPTVYDFAHIGNARPVIVFDVLFRLLRHCYGEDHVTYVRNITDVDDKINARALRDYPDIPLNEAIRNVTEKTANQFHADVKALGCLEPTHEPRATEHIEGMAEMIQTLLDKGNAYVAKGEQGREVLFRVNSMADYGQLSNRKLEEQQAGARVAVESHKENPGDFVLWKESGESEPGWEGTFNGETIHGRPGWHIECSVMAKDRLGKTFDIHGGGLDLIFPHHENEIAQSRCAHDVDHMAKVWMHNGYLQVEGKKMSKSEGNFVTIHDLLHTEKFGGRKWPGEVLRLAMLMTHYREPIDFSVKRLEEAENLISKLHRRVSEADNGNDDIISAVLSDELNTTETIAKLNQLSGKPLLKALRFLGIEFSKIQLDISGDDIDQKIKERLGFFAAKNFAEADRIRDELAAQGIQLKDSKDSQTGERITTWEVKR
ncbi:MAG: cysteine--tRNA ligase [Rhizobiaceae bacterium]